MQTKNLSAVPNEVARFLGSTIRRVENDFKSLVPFSKCSFPATSTAPKAIIIPKERPAEIPKAKFIDPVVIPKPEQVIPRVVNTAPAVLEVRTPPTPQQEIPVVSMKEDKPVIKEITLKNIEFENKAEQIKAEIYFRDLQSQNRTVRMAALAEIKKLSRPMVIAVLEQLLAKERDTIQLIELLNALASLGDETLIPKNLFLNYVGHRDSGIRLAALRAISKYHDEESFTILTSYSKDKDTEVRRQILNCLCWSFGDRCLPFAINSFHDSDIQIRKTAVHIVEALKAHQAISGLITLLSDPDPEVQTMADKALKKITGENFDFKVSAPKRMREAAIDDWRFWWRENQTKFSRSKT